MIRRLISQKCQVLPFLLRIIKSLTGHETMRQRFPGVKLYGSGQAGKGKRRNLSVTLDI